MPEKGALFLYVDISSKSELLISGAFYSLDICAKKGYNKKNNVWEPSFMRSDEFIATLSTTFAEEEEKFDKMRKDLPLGIDSVENVVYSHKNEIPYSTRLTCVTGGGKSAFIKRLLITLSCLHEKSEICFFVLSPNSDYGELLRLKSMEVTVPYIQTQADFTAAVETLKALLLMRGQGKGYPRLCIVVDGVEKLDGCNRNEDLEEQRNVIELLATREDVELILGVDLTKSIFSGYPGAFVGVGNCLVATRDLGRADVTYVNEDATLTMPIPMSYPDSPSITETVLFFNSVSK